MNNLNDTKPSKKVFLLVLLGILLVGIPLTVIALQQQQIFKNFAWSTSQSASALCVPEESTVTINVTFTNTDSRDMDVVAKDLQTGTSVNLGTVASKKTKTDKIVTQEKLLKKGAVMFTLKWTDKSSGTDTRTAEYGAVSECTPPPPFCPSAPEKNQGVCRWDLLEGSEGYEVEVKETGTGDVIKSESLPKTASESAFPMKLGKSYQCNVTPVNACGKGTKTKSPEKICTVTAPTPTVTPPICPSGPEKLGVCKWDELKGATEYNVTVKDTDSGDTIKSETVKAPDTKLSFPANPAKTYQCIVTAVNKCSETPPAESPPTSCTVPSETPTPTPPPSTTPQPSVTPLPTPTTKPSPTPTITPSPTLTPTPTITPSPTVTPSPRPTSTPYPTPTPIVIVRITPNNVPTPQQVIVQQTQAVVQQQPPVVVQQPPQTVVVQTTPAPTMKPTGSLSNSLIMAGASVVLLLVGGVLFLLL